jgi:hypothetical protein
MANQSHLSYNLKEDSDVKRRHCTLLRMSFIFCARAPNLGVVRSGLHPLLCFIDYIDIPARLSVMCLKDKKGIYTPVC